MCFTGFLHIVPGEISARKNIDQAIIASKHAAKLSGIMLAYSGKGILLSWN